MDSRRSYECLWSCFGGKNVCSRSTLRDRDRKSVVTVSQRRIAKVDRRTSNHQGSLDRGY